MTTSCPTCGQNVPEAQVLVDLKTNRVAFGEAVVTLVLQEAELLFALVRGAPLLVPHERLQLALWGEAGSATRAPDSVKVHISRLRRKIAPLGLAIETHRKEGYSLHADQAVLRAARQAVSRRRAA